MVVLEEEEGANTAALGEGPFSMRSEEEEDEAAAFPPCPSCCSCCPPPPPVVVVAVLVSASEAASADSEAGPVEGGPEEEERVRSVSEVEEGGGARELPPRGVESGEESRLRWEGSGTAAEEARAEQSEDIPCCCCW